LFKANKNHKNLFVVAKLILFVGVLFLLYFQLRYSGLDDWKALSFTNPVSFVIALILVFPNIWFAYLKWKVTLQAGNIDSSLGQRVQSFFAGIVTGMLTPNMIGNFLGRMYYFDKERRGLITTLTLYANYAQFITSMLFGWIALLLAGEYLAEEKWESLPLILGLVVLVSYVLYFLAANIGRFIKIVRQTTFDKIGSSFSFQSKLLLLSYARFFTYTVQFMLMLNAFGVDMSFELLLAIWQVYLLTMIAPSLFLGKVAVKESIAILILSQLGLNNLAILFASLLIWLINSLSPALVGLIVCRKK
jgi:hypothetical protein